MNLSLFGYRIDLASLDEAVDRVISLGRSAGFKTVTTLNASMVAEGDEDPWLREYMKSSSLILADGAGITLGCFLKYGQRVTKVAGVELVERLFMQEKASLFLIGGSPEFIEDTVTMIGTRYPRCRVVGFSDGYLTKSDRESLCLRVAEASPDIVLVGMGVPLQERLIAQLGESLAHGVAIGVGGSFDVVFGQLKRAPRWIVRCHVEWLYRGICQPYRIKKWGQLLRFCGMFLKSYIPRS